MCGEPLKENQQKQFSDTAAKMIALVAAVAGGNVAGAATICTRFFPVPPAPLTRAQAHVQLVNLLNKCLSVLDQKGGS